MTYECCHKTNALNKSKKWSSNLFPIQITLNLIGVLFKNKCGDVEILHVETVRIEAMIKKANNNNPKNFFLL